MPMPSHSTQHTMNGSPVAKNDFFLKIYLCLYQACMADGTMELHNNEKHEHTATHVTQKRRLEPSHCFFRRFINPQNGHVIFGEPTEKMNFHYMTQCPCENLN